MTTRPLSSTLLLAALLCAACAAQGQALNSSYARDPNQAVDQQYSQKIKQYTTDPTFISPLVDYLPASKTVPTPVKVLEMYRARPTCCPTPRTYTEYFRLLESASPRVKVFSIGKTEEGREMIAAAIADPECSPPPKRTKRASPSSPIPALFNSMTRRRERPHRSFLPRLLHHRHRPFPRDRRAHRADGTCISAGRG